MHPDSGVRVTHITHTHSQSGEFSLGNNMLISVDLCFVTIFFSRTAVSTYGVEDKSLKQTELFRADFISFFWLSL